MPSKPTAKSNAVKAKTFSWSIEKRETAEDRQGSSPTGCSSSSGSKIDNRIVRRPLAPR